MAKIPTLSFILLLECIRQACGDRTVQPCGPKLCEALCHGNKDCSAKIFDEIQLSCKLVLKTHTVSPSGQVPHEGDVMQRSNSSESKKPATPEEDLSRCPYNLPRTLYLHAYGERCFEFHSYRETDWTQAQQECAHKGGSLVTVDDKEIQTFLENTLMKMDLQKNGFWIGLNDRKEESSYQWISGVPLGYTNWGTGEPSLFHDLEDCILLLRETGFHWADHTCDSLFDHFGFICEYDKLPITTTRVTTLSEADSANTEK